MSRELEFSITSSQTTIKVSTMLNSTDFPIPGVILIGTEKIRYSNLTDREFIGCIRGFEGTSAVAHALGEDVTYFSAAPSTSTTIDTDQSSTAGDTRLLLWDVDAGSLVRVSVGAADSGGATVPAVAASGSVSVNNYLLMYPAEAACDVYINDYSALSGKILTIAGHDLVEGVDWTAAISNNDTAISLAAAVDTLSEVYGDAFTNIVSVIANVQGAAGNLITISSNDSINMTPDSPTLTNGADNGVLTINGVDCVQGVDWTAAVSNNDTATSLANAINTNLSGVVTATANLNVITIDAVTAGSAGNLIGTISFDQVNLSCSGSTLSGGADATPGYKVLRIPN